LANGRLYGLILAMILKRYKDLARAHLVALYDRVGWGAYTADPEALVRAVAQSTYAVTAWEGGRLIGLARGLSDDVSIFYLQDILVRPEYQGQGVGRALLGDCLERFEHVRQKVLLTDDEESQRRFYESLGYVNIRDYQEWRLNAYVQFREPEA
jgi:GNAT superfamily N-acetyltransferase